MLQIRYERFLPNSVLFAINASYFIQRNAGPPNNQTTGVTRITEVHVGRLSVQ